MKINSNQVTTILVQMGITKQDAVKITAEYDNDCQHLDTLGTLIRGIKHFSDKVQKLEEEVRCIKKEKTS